jgi:hypothetical protein
MFEVGKQYKAPSGYVCVVLFVGEKVALVRVTETGDGNGTVGAEFVISKDLNGYAEYTPPKVFAKTVTIGVSADDKFCIHTEDVDFLPPGYRIGTVTIGYTAGGRLTTRVVQD